jgi:hypothetical protein
MNELIERLKQERLATYVRLRGGFPMPLAGMIYWAALGVAGYYLSLEEWLSLAFPASGVIFPLGVLLSWLLRAPFLKDKSVVGGLMLPALVGMLLFWPMVVAATWTAPKLSPLILAIGMSMHWPVVGWMYARTPLFSAHAIVRAIACFYIWLAYPDMITTLLPFAVAAVYGVTTLVILVDVALVRRKAGGPARALPAAQL